MPAAAGLGIQIVQQRVVGSALSGGQSMIVASSETPCVGWDSGPAIGVGESESQPATVVDWPILSRSLVKTGKGPVPSRHLEVVPETGESFGREAMGGFHGRVG